MASADPSPLDPDVLERLRGHVGRENVERVVGLFRENVRERQVAAETALGAGDQRGLVVALHSIKGSAQLVGARRLEALAGEFEESARRGDLESVGADALSELALAFQSVEDELDRD